MSDAKPIPAALRERGLDAGALFADRYEVRGLLGVGAMGAVLRVFDRAVGEEVALKVLTPTIEAESDAVERMRQEVRLARRVTHANVARIYDLGEHAGVRYLTMELVRGVTLRERLRATRRLEPAHAIATALQIANGLAAAHAAGVIHRDLKPTNILVTDDDRAIVTDFGIARTSSPGAELTVGIGTPRYMSPEQISGGAATTSTDVYALGLLLYEMLTGVVPLAGDAPVPFARVSEDAPDPRTLVPINGALAELIVACLARDQNRRPTADAVARSLTALASVDLATDATLLPEAPTSSAPTRSQRASPVTAAPRARVLAVLPMRYRGPADSSYLADALTDDIIDVLCHTRELTVLSRGATERFADARDPKVVREASGAELLLDATVTSVAERIQLAPRLVETERGVQLWADRFDASLRDALEAQQAMALRIAETLRVQIAVADYERIAPHDAIAEYLRARSAYRAGNWSGEQGVLSHLDRCLTIAPDFKPAHGLRALAAVRAWFMATKDDVVLAQRAEEFIAAARQQAPDLLETRLAQAYRSLNAGDYVAAVEALDRVLQSVPTCVPALEIRGQLLVETGRRADGVRDLRRANMLDPLASSIHTLLAQVEMLDGRFAEAEHWIDASDSTNPGSIRSLSWRVRCEVWRRDAARARTARMKLGARFGPAMVAYAVFGHADGTPPTREELVRAWDEWRISPNVRRRAYLGQMAIEGLCAAGEVATAIEILEHLSQGALIDVTWLDGCPVLEPMRADAKYPELYARVAARAQGLWSG